VFDRFDGHNEHLMCNSSYWRSSVSAICSSGYAVISTVGAAASSAWNH